MCGRNADTWMKSPASDSPPLALTGLLSVAQTTPDPRRRRTGFFYVRRFNFLYFNRLSDLATPTP
jgi:hypothetical protein